MATMMIAGERYEMPVWLKARLLEVQETDTVGVLSVESGTERGKYYPVRHDGHSAISCPCKATGECAHMQAATRYLVSVEVLGVAMAEDLSAHIEDDLTSHEEEYGELAAEAEAIIAAEKQAQEMSEQQAAWAILSRERQRELYSELYPDDYGYVA